MLKLILALMISSLSLMAEFNLKPLSTPLLKVEDIYGYVKDSENLTLYSSGVVMHRFKESQSIIARAEVIEKKNGIAKLEFSVFDSLAQEALPLPNVLPEVGDEVILNFLYDRGLVIAPDKQSYDFLVQNFPQIYFTHIDILGAQLIRTAGLAPKRSDLRKFCSENAVGVLVFALENKFKIVDCQSFMTLYEEPLSVKPKALQTPFYSRVSGYESNFFDFNEIKMGNFYRYYEALIDLRKAKEEE